MEPHAQRPIPLRILALDPGTRELGYAVLEGAELLHFGVHTVPYGLSAEQLLEQGWRFVATLRDTFAPQVLVIERVTAPHSRRSSRLPVLVAGLVRLAQREGLHVLLFTYDAVKITIVGDAAVPKRQIADTLVQRGYPYLDRYLQIDLRTRERYWENMFDAVALGLTAYEELTKQRVLNTFRLSSGR
jgi:Holliday junction resolvasome RuvABC endonuclease subunit